MKKYLIYPLTIIELYGTLLYASGGNEATDRDHIGIRNSEKYSRGRRGAPAKGVGRATGARVQIPLSPLSFPNDYFFHSKPSRKIKEKS